MHGKGWKAGPEHRENAQILDQHGIHAEFIQVAQDFHDLRHFLILDQDVDRHMHPHMMQMRKMHSLPEFLPVEVARACAR